ncbi:hypothetical protein EUTSA_v10026581mg [Eutrema salsugineum]|uniref:DUF7887 domain-containing protein n=2 Tax=Eutrema TaxID=98005 RepID=V4MMS1_EUTSA|nr:uncharacterized protein LOC18030866 [Eutrema salsugineum]ESQ54113.1 hypothetical protein EUTSA_v10026581mg [Eutrema salsugineum]BAJ33617.1 unnamed protein product [Eutrema halophilum]
MLTLQVQNNSFTSPNGILRSFGNVFRKSGAGLVTVVSKKRDFPEKSNGKRPVLQIKVPNTILARSAIAVLGLGFIDAGYSGDWSRIGSISKETEELLKIAAFLVVPLSIFLALSFSDNSTD